jgi:16S rRNA (cytidine1402-2'-O)-methyltransferase
MRQVMRRVIPQSAATGPQAPTETRGRLFLVPNALDLGGEAGDLREVLPDGVLRIAARLQYWAVEDARSTRAFLKRVDAVHPLSQALQALHIAEMPRPQKGRPSNSPAAARAAGDPWADLLAPAWAGHDLGVLSEAGLPGVADPGARLVDAAHRAGLEVLALPGPSSLVLALAASGLQGQQFAFVGYLPQEPDARARRIRELEALSRKADQTQLLIETPYRNQAVLQALLAHLSPETRLSISIGLTLPGGFSRTVPVAQWRRETPTLSDRMPAVFALLGR